MPLPFYCLTLYITSHCSYEQWFLDGSLLLNNLSCLTVLNDDVNTLNELVNL